MKALTDFISATVAEVAPLHHTFTKAMWEAATTGSREANDRQREAEAALMRFWADPERFSSAKALLDPSADASPQTARQIRRIYLSAAKAQQDESTIVQITELEAKIRSAYYNHRAEVGGQRLTDNELDHILRTTTDGDLAHQAWLASKQVGAQVAEMVRQVVRLRNASAHKQGYRDHFQRSLTLNEIDEDEMMALFEELRQTTEEPYARLKGELDTARSEHFAISEDQLRPWHFGDRFFQSPPPSGDFDIDGHYAQLDLVELARATYLGLGMPVDDILARSDLYPRAGKDQHAFCLDLDRKGDIRTLNNLEASHRWGETLLHELGHAVYDKHIDADLPWLLRTPSHSLTTEAVALMMGSLTYDRSWIGAYLGLPAEEAERLSAAGRRNQRSGLLVFTRWCLVMVSFERSLYQDPEQDLDRLWWDLVERNQFLRAPERRSHPDWAAKYHLALVPVYYHNYLLGHVVSAQLQDRLLEELGGIAGNSAAGQWLTERIFRPGASQDWKAHLQAALGQPLSAASLSTRLR